MKKILILGVVTACFASTASAQFWDSDNGQWRGDSRWDGRGYGSGDGYGRGDGSGSGDMDTEFSMTFKGRGRADGRLDADTYQSQYRDFYGVGDGRGYGYNNNYPYYGYGGYPYGYPQAPVAPSR